MSRSAGAPLFADGGAGSALPDTPAARAAETYLAELSSAVMIRHCKRSYLFGKALADKAGAKPDLEALYVGCLLHDLGLEPVFAGPEDYETIGAREAGRFLSARGDDRLARQVSAAIDVHTSLESARDPRPEVAFLSMGVLVDVTGTRIDDIAPKLVQQVVADYPRDGTKALIGALLRREIEAKPQSRIGRLQARAGVLDLVANAPFPA
ncbi:MAG: HD domain-containing protein [Rhizobiales bacterium]|nr:HD domain-containing protein [Hyphomicrobiales bacterium]